MEVTSPNVSVCREREIQNERRGNRWTHLQTLETSGEATDQSELVAVDGPDQTGLFVVPLLYVHQLAIFDTDHRLQEAKEYEEDTCVGTLHYPS